MKTIVINCETWVHSSEYYELTKKLTQLSSALVNTARIVSRVFWVGLHLPFAIREILP